MLEAIVIAVISTFTIGAGGETFGPHQEPAKAETVAVLGSSGQVLYYNTK